MVIVIIIIISFGIITIIIDIICHHYYYYPSPPPSPPSSFGLQRGSREYRDYALQSMCRHSEDYEIFYDITIYWAVRI